ncbi:hypothetical protein [Alishewanella phage vB_AspM_Slickus01]|nr:hypothetical protein [Alishewanella phage vB_AspM_Slicko01]WGH49846.1 hypothetical protein [Alishewanella phage vB_AspM_Slickus01]
MITASKLAADYKHLNDVYEELLNKCEASIMIDGITLKEALKSQLQLQFDWELITKKLSHLYDMVDTEVETAYAESVKKELKDSYRSTSITEAKEFGKTDKDYIAFKKLLNNVKYLRDEARGVLETVNSRKYLLNNMTNAIVASVDDTII